MFFVLPPVEEAQAVYDRLASRLARIRTVSFVQENVNEPGFSASFYLLRPRSLATYNRSPESFATDGRRTTSSFEGINRLVRKGDVDRLPPGWEPFFDAHPNVRPRGQARETGDEIQIDVDYPHGTLTLRLSRKTGLPLGFKNPSVPEEYVYVGVIEDLPKMGLRVAGPLAATEITSPFARWLRAQKSLEVSLVRSRGADDVFRRETLEVRRPYAVRRTVTLPRPPKPPGPWQPLRQSPIPGFEPFFGGRLVKGKTVGIRYFDFQEAYVVRRREAGGSTDFYYATEAKDGVRFPLGYERFAKGRRAERVGIEIVPQGTWTGGTMPIGRR